ncbi:GlsB/YeaQ/YmgE family stress response membrane protein [Lichenibacterium ramalinae]|uniref:GlsB/YeaQ/YmgE family stress response membrane protein n=1 Tax=Lichenibacterium ramalinae TaxID=2316527 RepID=A0A4Q2RDR6_9HYPH|nr:GlsB/YeaQ/YmgE family stress response membrane protein [Lichenibacterium ramalinae]RYB03411.1 GlsB/YeaQ/YmgE family stress response membrane protein [Lichenibacterium ramalinae]
MLFASLHTTNVVAILLIGLVAGWLASLSLGGGGLWRDLVTGLVGAVVGAVLLRAFGVVLPFRDPLEQYRLSPGRLGGSKPMNCSRLGAGADSPKAKALW